MTPDGDEGEGPLQLFVRLSSSNEYGEAPDAFMLEWAGLPEQLERLRNALSGTWHSAVHAVLANSPVAEVVELPSAAHDLLESDTAVLAPGLDCTVVRSELDTVEVSAVGVEWSAASKHGLDRWTGFVSWSRIEELVVAPEAGTVFFGPKIGSITAGRPRTDFEVREVPVAHRKKLEKLVATSHFDGYGLEYSEADLEWLESVTIK